MEMDRENRRLEMGPAWGTMLTTRMMVTESRPPRQRQDKSVRWVTRRLVRSSWREPPRRQREEMFTRRIGAVKSSASIDGSPTLLNISINFGPPRFPELMPHQDCSLRLCWKISFVRLSGLQSIQTGAVRIRASDAALTLLHLHFLEREEKAQVGCEI